MATTVATSIVPRREAGSQKRHSWTMDADESSAAWKAHSGGWVTLGTTSASTFGGGTLKWYAQVNIDGTARVHEIGGSSSTAVTGGVSVYLNECQIRPDLSGSTSPSLVAIAF